MREIADSEMERALENSNVPTIDEMRAKEIAEATGISEGKIADYLESERDIASLERQLKEIARGARIITGVE